MRSRTAERAIEQYRRWYGRLLRLYPTPFRRHFAEPMAQTFTDVARERMNANRSLAGFAVATFVETIAGILRENLHHMTIQTKNYLRWVLVTAAVLAVPAVAMALNLGVPDPGSGTEGVNWGPMDFAMIGVLVLGAGLLYEYASTRASTLVQRAAVGLALLAGLGLVWVNLAVGMMDVEPGNLLYVFVLAAALIGAAVSRFALREASVWMFMTAGTQALVVAVALVAGLGPTWGADLFFIGAWVVSGLLFRRASLEPSPSA